MARLLHDDQIEGFLSGSGDEGSDDEEQQDMPFPGQETSILSPSESQSSSSSDEDMPLSNLRWKKKKFHEKFGMGPAVVLRLASTLPEGSFLYFDRYFSSLPLMQELQKRNMDGTGTLMMNRFNTKKSKYELKKDAAMKRGEYEEIVRADEKICILKWKDNKCVLMTSTAFGSEPVSIVPRWEKKSRYPTFV
ncbi:unnamed protein product [Parnassius apollo]|uniref:(apollo) hypothetical protein n=1 Tax=Parnassius apollo TaxID=110799 RepID=A0A8S3W8D2_PARAO|nr:unnamed protein product [Parnassius apollo]